MGTRPSEASAPGKVGLRVAGGTGSSVWAKAGLVLIPFRPHPPKGFRIW